MYIKHIALECSSEEKSDRFYGGLLNLEKKGSKSLPLSLSQQLFNSDKEYQMVNYADDTSHFEIFINPSKEPRGKTGNPLVDHICLEVDDRKSFLNQCMEMGVDIINVKKEDKEIIFIKDFDGNLFEIK